jgi:hypothetical protein
VQKVCVQKIQQVVNDIGLDFFFYVLVIPVVFATLHRSYETEGGSLAPSFDLWHT